MLISSSFLTVLSHAKPHDSRLSGKPGEQAVQADVAQHYADLPKAAAPEQVSRFAQNSSPKEKSGQLYLPPFIFIFISKQKPEYAKISSKHCLQS